MKTENNLVLAMVELESIAVETISIGKSIERINTAISKIKTLGFTSIQSGLGKAAAVKGELPYVAFKKAVSSKFEGKTGRQLTEAFRDLRLSINHALESGITVVDSNPSRQKAKTEAKTTRATAIPKPFDAKKACLFICGKYTANELSALIPLLQAEILLATAKK